MEFLKARSWVTDVIEGAKIVKYADDTPGFADGGVGGVEPPNF